MSDSPYLIDLSLRAYRWFQDGLPTRLEEAGWPEITRAQSNLFGHLGREGTRPSELARRIGVTRQAVHQTAQELIELGFVELAPDPTSRRAKLVVLTPRGRELVTEARAILRDLENELARRIGRKSVTELRRALEADWGQPVTEAGDSR